MTRTIAEWSDPDQILAIMLFPNDPERRERYRAIRAAQSLLRAGTPDQVHSLNADAFRLLTYAAADNESLALMDGAKRAIIAGDVMAVLYGMHRWAFPEPSLGKAIYAIQEFFTMEIYADNSPLPRSDAEIRSCINDYRTVSHLWAASRFHPNRWRAFYNSAEFRSILGIARMIQEFGLAFIPKHRP